MTPTPAGWDRPRASRSVVRACHGMVAAAQPLAVEAGVRMLRAGGSAVDAALAANAVLALVEPVSCGLGGDLFALLHDPADGSVVGLDASGRAPAAARIEEVERGLDGTIPLRSTDSWTVPGAVGGWFALHARYGRLGTDQVFGDAIRLAREGFPVSEVIASAWGRAARAHREQPGFADVFLPRGRAPREGEIFTNPALARVLSLLAEGGRDAFYAGAVADELDAYSRACGGRLRAADLAANEPTWVAPLSATFRGCEVWQLPPPGQGLTVLEMLNLVEDVDFASLGRDSADWWHLLVEAKKVAFADRARHFADPAFADVPAEQLASKAYARARRALIDPARAALRVDHGDPRLALSDTTYLAAADESGLMVSLIQSNYTGFGSGHAVPSLGFSLQNRGALFALDPAHPNALVPGKRPFHTIIPGFVTRAGAPWLAFGVMGGDMQPQGHVQVLLNLLEHGMNLQEAGDAPRFHHGGSSEPTGTVMHDGGELHLEPGVAPDIVQELRKRGHRSVPATGVFGGYQAVARDAETGAFVGATESRKDGCALGW